MTTTPNADQQPHARDNAAHPAVAIPSSITHSPSAVQLSAVLPARAVPSIPDNLPKRGRAALLLQSLPSATLTPITRTQAAHVAGYLPPDVEDAIITANADTAITEDTRLWLAPSVNVTCRNKATRTPASVAFGPADSRLTGVERVLWPELGIACARALSWMYHFLITKRWGKACELVGCESHEVTRWRDASPVFNAMFTAIESAVRTSRTARTEDTLHALANGDVTRTKQVINGATGEVVTLSEQLAPSVEAVKLELEANDPARYSPKSTVGAAGNGVTLSIVFGGLPGFLGKPATDGQVIEAELVEPSDLADNA